MKLVSFGAPGAERAGVLSDDGQSVIDVNATASQFPNCVKALIQGDFLAKFSAVLADKTIRKVTYPLSSVRLGAPVPVPGQIICVGLNYKDHADEQGVEYPKSPLLFGKSPAATVGPNDDVVYPQDVTQLDYEVELGVVIGKTAKNVTAENALEYVAGYCTFHDVSARCCQFGDKQWFRGKSFDTFAPFGPALVTKDEVPNPNALELWCTVNGETRQKSTTANLIHSVEKVIAHITRGITLRPGDVIATGTPAGVGVFFKPPRLLQRGDIVEMEVRGLGRIKNKIV